MYLDVSRCILMYLDVCERDTSRYKQDTCKIHHDTTGYVSDRKSPPKTIGNPPSPGAPPPGFFRLFAIGELVGDMPCVILAASWWVSGDGQCRDDMQ